MVGRDGRLDRHQRAGNLDRDAAVILHPGDVVLDETPNRRFRSGSPWSSPKALRPIGSLIAEGMRMTASGAIALQPAFYDVCGGAKKHNQLRHISGRPFKSSSLAVTQMWYWSSALCCTR